MRVCILSDSHDNRRLLAAAVSEARQLGAQAVLHAGDVVAPSTLSVLRPLELPVHLVHGNNTGDLVALMRMSARKGSLIHYHGADADLDLGGRRIFMVHYPHYARGMAALGDWDLVCCGHDHQAAVARVANVRGGETLLVNPGTVGGIDAPATYILADLERLEFQIRPVPGGAQVPG